MTDPRTVRVLLIEDDPDDLMLIQEHLSDSLDSHVSFRLACADSLERGLKLLVEEPFDAVLLDLMLSDSQGIQTFLSVHGQAPDLPVVILTGLLDERLALEAVGLGAQDYLIKSSLSAGVLRLAVPYAIERSKLAGRLERLVQDSPDGMVVTDRAGTVLFVNAAVEGLLGEPSTEMLGRPFPYTLQAGRTTEIHPPAKEGDERSVELRVAETEWKKTPAFLCVLRDLSPVRRVERLKAEVRERQRLERLRDDLLATVTRELWDPLTVLKSCVHSLKSGAAGPLTELQKKLLDMLQTSSDRLAKVSENLLDVSRIESSTPRLDRRRVEPSRVVEACLARVRRSAEERGVALESEAGSAPPADADAELFDQVLFNLLENAIRFAKARVRVTAAADPESVGPGQVLITVSDDGPGIPERERQDLLRKVVPVVRPMGEHFSQGAGMGLFLCREIVERHGGRIWIESAVGGGTQVHFTLPVHAQPESAPAGGEGGGRG